MTWSLGYTTLNHTHTHNEAVFASVFMRHLEEIHAQCWEFISLSEGSLRGPGTFPLVPWVLIMFLFDCSNRYIVSRIITILRINIAISIIAVAGTDTSTTMVYRLNTVVPQLVIVLLLFFVCKFDPNTAESHCW